MCVRQQTSDLSPPAIASRDHPHQQLNLFAAADDQRRALVQAIRSDIQNSLHTIGGNSACLFSQKCNGIGFVEQAKLAPRELLGWRIEKNASPEQRAMKIRHERANVTR